jgi:hypothetical protein
MAQHGGDVLERRLGRWIEAGIIDADRLSAIADFEAGTVQGPDWVLAAQVMGYVGVGVCVMAAGLWLGNVRGLLAATTGVMFGGAVIAAKRREPAMRRLRSVGLFLGCIGTAAVVALFAAEAELRHSGSACLVSGAALVVAVGSWLWHRSALQQFAMWASTVAFAVSIVSLSEPRALATYGLALWPLGAVWVVLACARRIKPRADAAALGGLTALLGVALVCVAVPPGGFWAGLATAGALLAASMVVRGRALLVIGTLGVLASVGALTVFSLNV